MKSNNKMGTMKRFIQPHENLPANKNSDNKMTFTRKHSTKFKTIILAVTLSASALCTSALYAQNSQMSKEETVRMDSMQSVYGKEQARDQKSRDATRMTNVKNNRKETKAKAKEARRIEREANDADRESINAVRTEKRAQRARKQADLQVEKAAKAKSKSDSN